MPSDKYTLQTLPDTIRTLQITTVRVVCHTEGPVVTGAQLSQNHWSIYLLIANGSVRVNMSIQDPRSSDDTGKLLISLEGYQVSNTAIASWDFGVLPGVAVWQLQHDMIEKGRGRYRMAEGGVGCRFWIQTVMNDWQQKSWVGTQTAAGFSLEQVIAYNWSRNQTPIPLEIKRGAFF